MGCAEQPFQPFCLAHRLCFERVRSPSGAQDLSPACLLCFSISSAGTASKPDWETLVAVSQRQAGEMPRGLVTAIHMDGCHQCGRPGGDAQFRAHRCPLLLQPQPCWGRLRHAVLGKTQCLLRAITPLIMVRGRNKMFPRCR